jgi:hypothetical protein
VPQRKNELETALRNLAMIVAIVPAWLDVADWILILPEARSSGRPSGERGAIYKSSLTTA